MRKLLVVFISFLLHIIVIIPALAQWSTPVRISDPNGCLYPQILAQGDTLHVIYRVLERLRGIGYIRSTDAGLTWSPELELSDAVNTNPTISPRIMAWHNKLLAVWRTTFINGFYRDNIGYAISHDDGINWSEPAYLFESNWNLIGFITAANNDSVVNMIITSSDTIFYDLRSTDFGVTWSDPIEILRMATTFWPDQAATGSIVHFSWDGEFNESDITELYYFRSTDYGLSWSENEPISSIDNIISEAPSIAVDESGNPAISWWDFKYSPYQTTGDVLSRWSFDQGQSWGQENQVTQNHLADISDVSWAQDTIRIVWMDWRLGGISIYYTSAGDSDGIWGPDQRIDDNPGWSFLPAVTASNGIVYVVWYEGCCTDFDQECCGIYISRNPAGPDAISEDILPEEFEGLSAYPNPFNSSISIDYSFQNEKGGELAIYDIQGQLIQRKELTGKEGRIKWDARDAKGNKVSSGIYFAKAEASHKTYSLKLLYLK